MTRILLAVVLLACSVAGRSQSLVFMADINGRYGSVDYHPRIARAVQRIIELQPTAVVLAGDMIAGQATPPLSAERLARMWRGFEQVVGGPLRAAGIAVIPVAGNHDASAFQPFSADRAAYEDYWLAHAPALVLEAGSRYPWHYAVSLGGLRLVALYATAPGALAPDQYGFLLRLLTGGSPAGPRTLLVSHLPVYPIARGRERETIDAELPADSGVAAWFSGHHHAYYPGRTVDGNRYIAIPALGGNQRQWLESAAHGPFGFLYVAASGAVTLHAAPEFEPRTIADMPGRIGALQLMREPSVYAVESPARGRSELLQCCE